MKTQKYNRLSFFYKIMNIINDEFKEVRRFGTALKLVCIEKAIIKIIAIPVALITAQLLSAVIDHATSGEVSAVFRYTLTILLFALMLICFQTVANILVERQQAKAVNRCKIGFLDSLLENSPDRLFQADYGQLIENFTNDTDTVVRQYTEAYPGIVAGLVGFSAYFVFLLY